MQVYELIALLKYKPQDAEVYHSPIMEDADLDVREVRLEGDKVVID